MENKNSNYPNSLGIELDNLLDNCLKNLWTKEEPQKQKETIKEKIEESILFIKHMKCPCCEKEIEVRTIKSNKIRMKKQDINLRNIYNEIDFYRYELVWCNSCGYATISSFVRPLTTVQTRLIKTNISDTYKPIKFENELELTFEEAVLGYKLALVNSVVKQAKALEKTYILLKYSYIIDYQLEQNISEEEKNKLKNEKEEIYKQCFIGFQNCLETETLSDKISITIIYLIAYIAIYLLKNCKDIEKEISNIKNYGGTCLSKLIMSRMCPTYLKENINILKEELMNFK